MRTHPFDQFLFCPRCGGQPFEVINTKAKRCVCCEFVYYFNPSAACVAVITNEKDELLVSRRAKEPAVGSLDLPGGFVDPYETAEMAVKREVLEETGLEVVTTNYLFSIANIYPYSGFEVHTVDLFFQCTIRESINLTPADDVSELMWIPVNELNVSLFGLNSIQKSIPVLSKMLSLQ